VVFMFVRAVEVKTWSGGGNKAGTIGGKGVAIHDTGNWESTMTVHLCTMNSSLGQPSSSTHMAALGS